jgi:hypothetical protein
MLGLIAYVKPTHAFVGLSRTRPHRRNHSVWNLDLACQWRPQDLPAHLAHLWYVLRRIVAFFNSHL